MRLPIYQVDAFADTVFAGNPAAVCPLDEWLPDDRMQAIAAENNLSETAFLVREGERYGLRWFTPETEVDLCGHATLASAYVLMTCLGRTADRIEFRTLKAGVLAVTRDGERLTLDLPARPPRPCPADPDLVAALGGPAPREVQAARDYLVVYEDEATVRALRPGMARLARVERFATIVTAPGRDVDFVSRFFAPAQGLPEDPVTGSAHCTLVPYWAERLGRTTLEARQVSARGGALGCRLAGDRVLLSGHVALYREGTLHL